MLATSKFGLVRSCRQGRRSNAETMTHIYADHKKLPFHQQSKLNCGHVHTVCVCALFNLWHSRGEGRNRLRGATVQRWCLCVYFHKALQKGTQTATTHQGTV